MNFDNPAFQEQCMPVRDAVLALSAHYKRRPGNVDSPFLVAVPRGHRSATLRLLDGFDVEVVESGSERAYGARFRAIIFVGSHPQPWVDQVMARRHADSAVLRFPG